MFYTRAYIELYHWQNYELVHKTYGITKVEKWRISGAKNLLSLIAY